MEIKEEAEAEVPAAELRAEVFDFWEVLTCKELRPQDRVPLVILISEWLTTGRPLCYSIGKLSAALGLTDVFLHGSLDRLQQNGWLTWSSVKGRFARIEIRLTTYTLGRFRVPPPDLSMDLDIPYELAPFVMRANGDQTNEIRRRLKRVTRRSLIKEIRAEEPSTDGVSPLHDVTALIRYFEDKFMRPLNYTPPRDYSAHQAISEAEECIADRPLAEWKRAIDWVRAVKKRLVKDDFVLTLKVYRVRTLKTIWNLYLDAEREGRTTDKKSDPIASAYDRAAK